MSLNTSSTTNVASNPQVLLLPTVRLPPPPPSSHSPASVKPTSPKLSRSYSAQPTGNHRRSNSVSDPPPYTYPSPASAKSPGPPSSSPALQWLGLPLRFRILVEHMQIEGFRLYAVEKWIVERTRPVTVLAVHTGDPSHRITVTSFRPSPELSPTEAQEEWDKALHHLKRDGARPKETPHGVIMATSLAHFRSDFTIVRIPGGDFLSVREHLYANINLLRMGCSGRSALTLEDPSETTKDRFTSMYHLPDTPIPAPPSGKFSNPLFYATVLELIKLVQVSLFIYGMYTETSLGIKQSLDGLLCDVTIDCIQRWVAEIGEAIPELELEPSERVADPSTVSAMLSIIMSVRNKLVALGYSNTVPKDPFLRPQAFIHALAQYTSQLSSASLPHFPHLHMSSPLMSPAGSSSVNSMSPALLINTRGTPQTPDNCAPVAYLTRQTIDNITAAYDKIRHSESSKVHRFLNRLDFTNSPEEGNPGQDELGGPNGRGSLDTAGGVQLLSGFGSLTSGLRIGAAAGGGAANITDATSELDVLVSQVVGKDKARKNKVKVRSHEGLDITDSSTFTPVVDAKVGGVCGSVRGLWSGRIAGVVQLRQRELGLDQPVKEPEKRYRSIWGAASDGDAEEQETDKFKVASEGDESDYGLSNRPWSGRMQKKIDAWTGRHRKRNGVSQSVDLTGSLKLTRRNTLKGLGLPSMSSAIAGSNASFNTRRLASADEDEDVGEVLSSGQASPTDERKTSNPFSLYGDKSRESSAINLLSAYEHERRLAGTERKRPWSNRLTQSRVSSWSDPISARGDGSRENILKDEKRHDQRSSSTRLAASPGAWSTLPVERQESSSTDSMQSDRLSPRCARLERRRSWTDPSCHRGIPILSPEHMRIDVELCGQYLVMIRREEHLSNVCECLELLVSSLSEVNTFLREDHERNHAKLIEADDRNKITAAVESEKVKCDLTTQEVQTLKYEFNLFRLPDLWHLVNPPRQKILLLREKVFGMGGRQLAPGTRGAHGSFNRLQWRLDGTKVLVDHLGRTESEAEEDEDYGETNEGEADGENLENVVENPSVKPMWLLRLFTSWGARWNAYNTPASASSSNEDSSRSASETSQQ